MRAQKFSTRTKARDQAGFKFWARFKKVTELNVMEIKNQLK
jgi:hypothetical protein